MAALAGEGDVPNLLESCLSLSWAVMDLVIAGGRGLGLTIADHHAIAALVAARTVPSPVQQVA